MNILNHPEEYAARLVNLGFTTEEVLDVAYDKEYFGLDNPDYLTAVLMEMVRLYRAQVN